MQFHSYLLQGRRFIVRSCSFFVESKRLPCRLHKAAKTKGVTRDRQHSAQRFPENCRSRICRCFFECCICPVPRPCFKKRICQYQWRKCFECSELGCHWRWHDPRLPRNQQSDRNSQCSRWRHRSLSCGKLSQLFDSTKEQHFALLGSGRNQYPCGHTARWFPCRLGQGI